LIQVSTFDFMDDAVGTEQAQLATHERRAAFGLGRIGRRSRKKSFAHIPVADAANHELASADDFQQGTVIGGERMQGANRAPFPLLAFLDRSQDLVQSRAVVHAGQGVRAALVDFLGHLPAPVQIGQPAAHAAPLLFPFRLSLLGAVHAEGLLVVHRHFDSQDATCCPVSFVVHLD
jgi:hypothetical protein